VDKGSFMKERTSALVMRSEPFGFIVYERGTSQYRAITRELGDMLISVSGYLTGNENRPPWQHHSIRFRRLRNELRRHHISLDTMPGTIRVIENDCDMRSEKLSFPLKIFLSVTERCELECLHCYACAPQGEGHPLSLPDIEGIIDEMVAHGCLQVSFNGGEPFLREDFPRILHYAKARGMWTSVATNGQNLTRGVVEHMKELEVDFLTLSLDGVTALCNDAIRRGGSFKRTIESARLLSSQAINWAVHFTAMKKNLTEIPLLPSLLRTIPCKNLIVTTVKPAGRALESGEVLLDREDMAQVSHYLQDMRRCNPWLNVMSFKPLHYHRGFGCPAGTMKAGISARGFMIPCDFLPARFQAGDVRHEGIEILWKEHPAFNFFRMLKGNLRCSGCEHYLWCRGGCRVKAFHATQDWNAPDCCDENHMAHHGVQGR
jgi:radical SAM protein with 4Fe4S-binding SPASM domain